MKAAPRRVLDVLAEARPAVVTADRQLAAELCDVLTAVSASPPLWLDSFAHAECAIDEADARVFFLDLRAQFDGQSPGPLLARLAQQHAPNGLVIALGNSPYACGWAREAELAIHGRLRLPFHRPELAELLQSEKLARRAFEPPHPLEPRVIEVGSFRYLTYTPGMYEMLDHLQRVAAYDVTLLLIGETGTGKTTIARLVHELSSHRQEPFLTVACGSLPRELIESELFGHVRGAFTSADRSKLGKFEAAGRGSLLLDEIDVLGPVQQTKLLRVIESGEFEPVGSNETRYSQARLIVASNVDLKELMDRDEFRPDLYYRLNVLEFHVPPLRERPRDIVPLTLGFIQEFSLMHGINIQNVHPEFLAALKSYDWPGNIRELKNHIRRAVLFCQNGELTVHDLALGLLKPRSLLAETKAGSERALASLSERVALTEQEILEAALRAHGYRRAATAQSLGISRVGLYKKMRKYGLLGAPRGRSPLPVVSGLASSSANSANSTATR